MLPVTWHRMAGAAVRAPLQSDGFMQTQITNRTFALRQPSQQRMSAVQTHLLSSLNPEKKSEPARESEVHESANSKMVEKLLGAFARHLKELDKHMDEANGSYNTLIPEELKNSGYTAQDIFALSLCMAEFQSSRWFAYGSGRFFSGLIKQSNETDFTITTEHWEVLPEKIGYQCSGKNIRVVGSVGYKAAQEMDGGTLEISGNAGDALAHHMESGIVIVRGNVGGDLGYHIEEGSSEIRVYGKVESVSDDVVCHDGDATPKVYSPIYKAPYYNAPYGWGRTRTRRTRM